MALCCARHVEGNKVSYTSGRVTSTVSPYTDTEHSGLPLVAFRLYQTRLEELVVIRNYRYLEGLLKQLPAPEVAFTTWMLLGDQTLMGPGQQG